MRFVGRGWNVIARVGEAVFPPYRRALPSKQAESCHVEVEPSTIAAALKTLSRRLRPRPHGVRMKINGHLVFEHQAEDARVVRAEVPVVRSTHRSEDLILGVSLRYLADAVAGTGLETMRFGGPLDPLVVEHEDKRIAVVMPMRI